MTRPTPPSTAATPLFSLPRIPYYFTITPYPLNCQGLQAYSSLASSPKRMKRRFNTDARNSRGDSNNSNLSSDQTSPLSAVGQQALPISAQHSLLNQHGGAGFVYPEDGNLEERDSGPESIDGRVLKRMRLIKLDSMSPPADVPQSPQNDSFRLSPALDQGQESADMGFTKGITPVRISTRSIVPQESFERSVLNQSSSHVENVAYSGMNVLLHQVHASRFGIPDESNLGNHSLYHQQQHEQRRVSQHQQQQLQEQHHHHHYQQRQQQLLQQQQHQARSNTGIPTYMTAWHQPPIHTTNPEDEDDEMTDVEEQMTTVALGTSQINFSPLQAQPLGYVLNQPQQHQVPQHSAVQSFALSNHAISVQAQERQHQNQQQPYQPQGPNLYQDINAQLRAAFLARAEMEQRYR